MKTSLADLVADDCGLRMRVDSWSDTLLPALRGNAERRRSRFTRNREAKVDLSAHAITAHPKLDESARGGPLEEFLKLPLPGHRPSVYSNNHIAPLYACHGRRAPRNHAANEHPFGRREPERAHEGGRHILPQDSDPPDCVEGNTGCRPADCRPR
jgi:hypothetical protein